MKKNAELTEFTFPGSGIKVHVPPMSPAGLAMKLRRKYPQPEPPRQVIDYGGGHTSVEINYSHPDYFKVLEDYNRFINEQLEKLLLPRAIRSMALSKEHRQLVQEWKNANPDLWTEADRDEEIFFEEICLRDEEDLMSFMAHVTGVDPSETEIGAAVNGFQRDIQGDTDLHLGDATERD